MVCALFIPEAWFANVQTMEPIVLKNLPPERFNKVDNLLCHCEILLLVMLVCCFILHITSVI